jgi:uncharacterized protein YfkK (UPF0435 family)
MPRTEFKTIRKETRQLLEGAEGYEVDFKRNAGGISTRDLVSFANSPEGGHLLIGVDEYTTESGQQRGKVVGCRTDDNAKLQIVNKAHTCTPQIDLTVYVENTNKNSFFRVDIPSGSEKPYCTQKGTYVTREDGRKRALLPPELLEIFVREQADRFKNRFRSVTGHLESSIDTLQANLQSSIWQIISEISAQLATVEDVSSRINDLERSIDESLRHIFDSVQNAEHLSDDAMMLADEAAANTGGISGDIEKLQEDVIHVARKANALLDHFEIEDPEIAHQRKMVRGMARANFKMIADRDSTLEDLHDFYEHMKNDSNRHGNLYRPYEEYVPFEDAKEWFLSARPKNNGD